VSNKGQAKPIVQRGANGFNMNANPDGQLSTDNNDEMEMTIVDITYS
jgi:hypothetical protein